MFRLISPHAHLSISAEESHQGNITEFRVVFFQSVCFVSDGRVVDRGQKSVSFLDYRLDRSIVRLNHQRKSLETQTGTSLFVFIIININVALCIVQYVF